MGTCYSRFWFFSKYIFIVVEGDILQAIINFLRSSHSYQRLLMAVRADATLGATVSDDVAIDRVEFFANGNKIGDSTTVSDGPATLMARAVGIGFNATSTPTPQYPDSGIHGR